MGRFVVALGVVAALCLVPAPLSAAPGDPKPPSAAEMAGAQKRANQAAARFAKAQTALSQAQREVADLQSHTAATQKVVDVLGTQVRRLAVQQYVQGDHTATWLGGGDPGEAVRSQAMLRYVTLGRTDSVEGYQVARADLEQSQAALAERLAQQRAVVADMRSQEIKVNAELGKLAAAQRAYDAKVAAERAAAAKAAAQRAQRASRSASANPVTDLVAAVVPVLGGGSWICPVQGPHAFSSDFGAPRVGHTHQGNDIMSPRGTPVVANVSGTVRSASSANGGISYYLAGDDGTTYFGAHLDHRSGANGHVAAGTVVGYVGTTGDAPENAPHLHFEIHPGGGRAVNPFPTLSKYC